MATSHDRFLCKSFSRYTPRAFREHSLDCCIDGVRGADTWGKTLLNKGFATRAGAPWARLRSASRRRRIAHAGVILAQDGSWRFFARGGDGGDAGRVLPRSSASRPPEPSRPELPARKASGAGESLGFGYVSAPCNRARTRAREDQSCKVAPWKPRFVAGLILRELERITGQLTRGARVLQQATQITAPHPSRAPAGTRYPKQSPQGTAAATSRCR